MTEENTPKIKLEIAQRYIAENEKDLWIVATSSNKDPTVKLFNASVSGRAAFLITPEISVAVVAELDRGNLPDDIFDDVITYTGETGFDLTFRHGLARLHLKTKEPQILANYNTIDDLTDLMTAGVRDNLKGLLSDEGYSSVWSSASELLYQIFTVKTPSEIEKLKYVAEAASDILENALHRVQVGMTEKNVEKIVDEEVVSYNDVAEIPVTYKGAFMGGPCPIVVSGGRIGELKSAHEAPTDKMIHGGEMVYIDFGVTAQGYSSDIQRMACMLKKDEEKVPEEFQHRFDTITKAIDAALSNLKPGIISYVPDAAARKVLKDSGYPDYLHSTGHQIGGVAHAPGYSLCKNKGTPQREILGNLPILENSVVTVEPRIALPNGCSIEEDVLVTKDGPKILSKRQTELWCIPYNPIKGYIESGKGTA